MRKRKRKICAVTDFMVEKICEKFPSKCVVKRQEMKQEKEERVH